MSLISTKRLAKQPRVYEEWRASLTVMMHEICQQSKQVEDALQQDSARDLIIVYRQKNVKMIRSGG